MPVTGVHMLFHSPEAESLRRTLQSAFDWPQVDVGEGWLIFAAPPAEIGVHPSETPHHEISLMCDDLDATITELVDKGVRFRDDQQQRRFGRTVTAVLPGEVEVVLYEPKHPTAISQRLE
jgi:hypothetical protein